MTRGEVLKAAGRKRLLFPEYNNTAFPITAWRPGAPGWSAHKNGAGNIPLGNKRETRVGIECHPAVPHVMTPASPWLRAAQSKPHVPLRLCGLGVLHRHSQSRYPTLHNLDIIPLHITRRQMSVYAHTMFDLFLFATPNSPVSL